MGACVSTHKQTRLRDAHVSDDSALFHNDRNDACLIEQVPLELLEMILMRSFVILYVQHYKKAIICAGRRTFSTLARVSFIWWQTLNGWPESDTRLWLKHQIVKQVAGLHKPKADRPRQLASINRHCQVRGVAQLYDCVYVVCAGYSTVEVFSASDCHWLDRVVVPGLDDPHDLQVCVETKRLYIADVNSVWSVRLPSAWARHHIYDIYPMSLSVSDVRLLVTCRSGHRLMQFAADGQLLRQVDLQRSIEVWHAVETSKTTFVVCHAHGISEVDVDGRVTRVCQYDQFLHPCHLTVINGGRLLVADYNSVLLLNSDLSVDRVLLHPDNDYNNDDKRRFSRPLRLNYSTKARRLLVACRSQFVNVYSWRNPLTPASPAVTDTSAMSGT